MAKYIDADALKESINELLKSPLANDKTIAHWNIAIKEALEMVKYLCIDKMPTADVEPVRKWISVDERLPEIRVEKEYYGGNFTGGPREVIENTISDPVLVAIKDWHNQIVAGTDFVYDGKWFNYNDRAIIAWMPLPEPPKMDEGENKC